ncbi:alcohol dehydrogenase [Burkholderia sp. WAC0059]|uniref:iron-containing alcohol dehydrogenase n=1 Tax=Burkholderia sp. WAC0059 TaxID=2066022 RepID=UPI000C7E9784|nr:iron-containing alcohol dehydrogenase [Burkholderia sp. WAC0059]PLZ01388.1 alcohol dehydrogenase [Burkholderia sp. WAC0059]
MSDFFGILRAPRAVLFGNGQRHALGQVAAAIGSRALVCTDPRFAASRDMNDALGHLRASGVTAKVFDGTQAELPADNVHACVAFCGDFRPDLVIGIGGGSCMDLAKLTALLLAHGGPLDRYYGEFKVPGPVTPVVAVTTTAGTGSEVTPVAVLADQARDLKVGISSPYLIPHTAICDAELTLTCPPGLTALSGADALTHAVEAFTAVRHPATPELAQQRVFVGKNLFSDQHALAAIRAIVGHLPRAVENGADLHARSMLMYGAVSAGLAFGVAGTAAAHAIQYPVGALTHTAHGLGVATLLPYVMAYNASACGDELAQIAQAIGIDATTPEAAAAGAIERIRGLCAAIGIPRTLADLGLAADRLDWVAEQSMLASRLVNNNPRKLSVAAIREIVDGAYRGSLSFSAA